MWIGMTSPTCIISASAWAPCACAQPVCKCQLALRPRYAPDARSNDSWGTSARSPTSAARVSSKTSMPFALAARATKRSRSASCGRTRKAVGCATSARRKRGHTDAPPATSTNLLLNSSIAGESSKLLSTPAARAARRARSASGASPTTAPWLQTRGCVRNAPLWQIARSAPYATGRSTRNSSQSLNGSGHHVRRNPAIGSCDAPHATNAPRAAWLKHRHILLKRLLHVHSAVPRRPAQYVASVSSKNSLATVSGVSPEGNPGIGHYVV